MKQIKLWWLLLLTGIIYLPSLTNPFIWDDEQFIYKNVYVQTFAIKEIFTQNTVAGAGELSNYYRPLTTLSFAIDYQFWGLTPFGFHLTNISLHILAGLLLWHILKKIRLTNWPRAVITSLFLLHPLQTEAVTYINSRGDSLYTFFGLLSVLLLLLSYESVKKISMYNLELLLTPWVLSLLAVVSYIASILSKEIGLAVGGLLVLIIAWKSWHAKTPLKQYISGQKPIFTAAALVMLVGIIYLVLRGTLLNFQNSFDFYSDGSLYTESLLVRLLTFSKIIFIYLQLLIFPFPLHMERDTDLVTTLLSPWPWLSLTLIGGLIWSGWREWIKHNTTYVWLGMGWVGAMLLPVSGIIPINGLLYEHWLYTPVIGWGIMLTGLLSLFPKISNYLYTHRVLLLSSLVLILGLLTIRQNYIWGDPIRFYSHVLRYSESARVHNNLAMAYADAGQPQDALEHYYIGLELSENYPQIHHNIANAYLALGERENAINAYMTALELSPTFFHSYYALLDIYIAAENYPEAVTLLKQGQVHLPTENNFHVMEMILYDRMKDATKRDEKIDWIRSNLRLDPELTAFIETYYQK